MLKKGQKIELGDKVKDQVSGFTGIVTGELKYLNGCEQVLIKPPIDKEGKMADSYWIDINQLEILQKQVLKAETHLVGGADRRVAA